MSSHHKRSATSDKRKKDAHADRGASGGGSEMPRTLRKHKAKPVASAMPYEKQAESPYSTYAPPTGTPPTTQTQSKTVRWGDQYMAPGQYATEKQHAANDQYMAEDPYMARGQYSMTNKWNPTSEQQSGAQFALDAMVSAPYGALEDTPRHAYPIRQDPHYSQPRPKSPSLEFEDRRRARACTGYSSSYGKTPSSNPYADELRKERRKNR